MQQTKISITLPSSKKSFQLISGIPNSITISKVQVKVLEMEDVLFHYDSAVMMPSFPEVGNKDSNDNTSDVSQKQRKVAGVKAIALVLKQFEIEPNQKILIAGHTDTSGGASYNFGLSELRASNVLYLLTGEENGKSWAEVCEKQHVIEDYQQIMQYFSSKKSWNCDPGKIDNIWGPKTEAACKDYFNHCAPESASAILTKIKATNGK